jgi:hypothetical protein
MYVYVCMYVFCKSHLSLWRRLLSAVRTLHVCVCVYVCILQELSELVEAFVECGEDLACMCICVYVCILQEFLSILWRRLLSVVRALFVYVYICVCMCFARVTELVEAFVECGKDLACMCICVYVCILQEFLSILWRHVLSTG